MTLDIARHKIILFEILKEIYADPLLNVNLGFKGGTAAFMFYDLDRFSVDLDFDLLDKTKEDQIFTKVQSLLPKYGNIKEEYKKRFNLFFLLSYQKGLQNIKIEINRRDNESQYELKNYLGVSMLVMKKEDMFANKLLAMSERIERTSRDIYDVRFFLSHNFPVNRKLIEHRSGLSYQQFIKNCLKSLEKFDNRHILNGLGELLSGRQKDQVKATLLRDTLALLRLHLGE